MNSADATLVLVTPVKKNAMFSPNAMPGISAGRRSFHASQRPSVTRRMPIQIALHNSMRQNATVTPGVCDSLTSVEPALKQMMTTTSAASPMARL